ncbi:eyes absent homolog 1-like [Labrus bergylta]|uniref:eyes absent homolog 1-like n=1 Tax=Labrus bergylta TaxID=56723 RepID=UPI003313B4EB
MFSVLPICHFGDLTTATDNRGRISARRAHSDRPKSPDPPLQPDGDLNIYNRPVEEFQLIYHAVVDDMLKFKSGRPRPYSIELGRRLKQKLWERLDRPTFTETVDEDGRMHVDMSVGGDGVYPPLYDVDTSGEPAPGRPPVKRARKQNSLTLYEFKNTKL